MSNDAINFRFTYNQVKKIMRIFIGIDEVSFHKIPYKNFTQKSEARKFLSLLELIQIKNGDIEITTKGREFMRLWGTKEEGEYFSNILLDNIFIKKLWADICHGRDIINAKYVASKLKNHYGDLNDSGHLYFARRLINLARYAGMCESIGKNEYKITKRAILGMGDISLDQLTLDYATKTENGKSIYKIGTLIAEMTYNLHSNPKGIEIELKKLYENKQLSLETYDILNDIINALPDSTNKQILLGIFTNWLYRKRMQQGG